MVCVRVSCLRSAHRGQARQRPCSRDLSTQGFLNRFIDVGATFRELPVFSVCPLMGLEVKTPPRNRRRDPCRRPPIASEGFIHSFIHSERAHLARDPPSQHPVGRTARHVSLWALCRAAGLWDLLILQNGAHAPLGYSLGPCELEHRIRRIRGLGQGVLPSGCVPVGAVHLRPFFWGDVWAASVTRMRG